MPLTLLLLLVIGYAGGATIDRLARHSRTIGLFVLAGGHFLLLGAVMGPSSTGFLSEEILEMSFPLLNLAFGWIGLVLGLQLDFRGLVSMDRHFWRMAIIQSTVAGGIAFFLCALYLSSQIPSRYLPEDWPLISQAFAVIAMMTSPIPLAYMARRHRLRGMRIDILRFIANIDGMFAIVLFQLVLIMHHPNDPSFTGSLIGPGMFGVAIILGIFLGGLSHYFLLYYYNRNDLLAILAGLLFFSDGLAYALQLSPLFINMITGCVLANVSPRREVVFRMLSETERPVYVTLLIFAGAYWYLPQAADHWEWLLALIGIYVLAKFTGGLFSRLLAPKTEYFGVVYGLHFLPQGAISLAMTITFIQYYPEEMSAFFQTVVITLFLVTNLAAHRVGLFCLNNDRSKERVA